MNAHDPLLFASRRRDTANVSSHEADRLWLLLAERVNRIGSEIAAIELELYRMGQHFAYETFPEAALGEVAARADQLAAYVRAVLARGEGVRRGVTSDQ